jgi:hypothetical protein
MMAKALEVRLGQFLVRVGKSDGRVDPDAGHALQGLVRHPHPGQRAVPRHDLRPRVPARSVDRSGQLLLHPGAAPGDLLQRPVRGRHRRDLPERFRLVGQHPEIADRAGAVRDRAGDVGQYPAPVMLEQPAAEQRLRQAPGQARLVRQAAHQPEPGMRHDPGSVAGDFQAVSPRGNVHFQSAP